MEHHEKNLIYGLLALIFIIFSVAMIRLYREQVHLKEMISVSNMQLSERIGALQNQLNVTPKVMPKK
jgi:hypothetical protein